MINEKKYQKMRLYAIFTVLGLLEIAYNDKIKCFLTFGNWLKLKIGHLLHNLPTTGGHRPSLRRKMKKSKISFDFLLMAQFAKLNG